MKGFFSVERLWSIVHALGANGVMKQNKPFPFKKGYLRNAPEHGLIILMYKL